MCHCLKTNKSEHILGHTLTSHLTAPCCQSQSGCEHGLGETGGGGRVPGQGGGQPQGQTPPLLVRDSECQLSYYAIKTQRKVRKAPNRKQ